MFSLYCIHLEYIYIYIHIFHSNNYMLGYNLLYVNLVRFHTQLYIIIWNCIIPYKFNLNMKYFKNIQWCSKSMVNCTYAKSANYKVVQHFAKVIFLFYL
jgi:hypothetical protein